MRLFISMSSTAPMQFACLFWFGGPRSSATALLRVGFHLMGMRAYTDALDRGAMNRLCIKLAVVGAGVGLSEKILQTITPDDQVTLVVDNQIIALKLIEKFGHPRTRSAHQVGKVLVSCSTVTRVPRLSLTPKFSLSSSRIRARSTSVVGAASQTGRDLPDGYWGAIWRS